MPETYWIFQRLGVLDKMKDSSFVRKVRVQFVSPTGSESQPFFFKQHDPRECSATWQVERADFDKLRFDNAAEKGADCFDQTRVLAVLFDGHRASGVRLQPVEGAAREIPAQVVVDAITHTDIHKQDRFVLGNAWTDEQDREQAESNAQPDEQSH